VKFEPRLKIRAELRRAAGSRAAKCSYQGFMARPAIFRALLIEAGRATIYECTFICEQYISSTRYFGYAGCVTPSARVLPQPTWNSRRVNSSFPLGKHSRLRNKG